MQAGFELFDHTADVGIRAFAPTREALVKVAAEGLYACIGELAPKAEKPQVREFDLQGEDAATLLRDYLTELLILFERDQRMATASVVTHFTDQRLQVRIESQAVDMERSGFDREVKAVTYHGLDVRSVAGGFEATVIVDI